MVTTDRPLPSCLEIERVILAAFLASKTAWIRFSGEILPEHFYNESHAKIFAFMLEANCTDQKIICEKYPDLIDTILSIRAEFSTNPAISSHLELLKDRAERRALIKASYEAQESAFSDFDTPASTITEKSILSLGRGQIFSSKPEHIGEIIPRVLDEMQNMINGGFGLKTGLRDIDDLIGGILDGEMVILAGRPSMGKTSMVLQIARHNAINKHLPSLIFSLETSKSVIVGRMMASHANASYDGALRGHKRDLQRITEEISAIAEAGIYIDDTAAITVSQIESKVENHVKNHGIKLVVIDHVGLIKNILPGRSRHEELSGISKSIKAIGKRFGIPTITLCQLSREVERRKPPIPMLSDLRESGSFEEDADKVFLLYREEYYDRNSTKKGIAEVIVAKNKNGRIGHREVVADLNTMNFRDKALESNTQESWQDRTDK